MADRNASEEVKPGLFSLDPVEREALLEDIASRDPGHVAERLRHVVEQLTAEGVFAGMSENEVRAVLREAVEDLGVRPGQGAN